ncbi:MAG TPA: sulfite exporter TauE/SafE family protein [Clostridiales bacterium]|nr:sulfite exporter TauE/SafE family protein [Clostridiales bacterium]
MDILGIDLGLVQWLAVILAAFLVGFSKTGIGGVMMLAIPILAGVFGGKDSTGIMLPMLIVGDIFAIFYYNRSAEWKNVITPLPSALIGLGVGVVIGNYINDNTFVKMIGIIVLFCLAVLIYTEMKGQDFVVPNAPWFYITVGILSGFASMIGNAAGPIFSVYLLALGFKKNNFMGINAWFFFIINLSKVPLQIFFWHNIGATSLITTAIMIPVITLGAVLGAIVLKKINEKYFRYLVIGMTAIAALKLLIK